MLQTEGEYSAATLDSMMQLICFLSIKVLEPFLVVTQNNSRNPNVSPLTFISLNAQQPKDFDHFKHFVTTQ